MKIYGGDSSIAPSADDVEQATGVFREHIEVLKDLFKGYDLSPFLNPEGDPALRYKLLAKAAEFVFISTQELNTQNNNGKSVQKVSFKTYFLKAVKRMRAAYDICQPSGRTWPRGIRPCTMLYGYRRIHPKNERDKRGGCRYHEPPCC